MVRKHIVTHGPRGDRGKRPRMNQHSNDMPQSNLPLGNPPIARNPALMNIINSNEILYGKQTVDEVLDALEITYLFRHQEN